MSYDDVIIVYVDEVIFLNMKIVEFLIMFEVVKVLYEVGMVVLMGVLNVVCGGFYFGNVFVWELVEVGYLDVLFLDYILVFLF